jgi:hypothetical protein
MTLADVSYYIRRYGPIGIIGFVLLILFFAIMMLAFKAISSRPVETVFVPAYGNISGPNFTNKFDYPPKPTFTLDNIEGRPVTATSSARIFFIPKPQTGLGYNRTVAFMGRAAGFDVETEKYSLNDIKATYENSDQKIDIDIRNGNFTYESLYKNQGSLFETAIIPEENKILQTAQAFLSQMNRYPDDFAKGTYNIIYQNYNPATDIFTEVTTVQEANVVEVDFFPPDIDGFPLVVPKYYNSQNYVVMVFQDHGGTPDGKIIKAQVKYIDRDLTESASYPVKTGDEAWKEFTDGKAAIVSAGPNTGTTITIKEMFLGYYDPEEYQEFLQPVYVFLGDNDFAAYVPAIAKQYMK